MLGNYLTTHPVFTLLEKKRNFVARKYALANKKQKKKNDELIKNHTEPEDKLRIIRDIKDKIKLKMITIMKELKLKNLKFSKKLNLILENLREYYIKLILEEKKYEKQPKKKTEEVKNEQIIDETTEVKNPTNSQIDKEKIIV